RLKFRSVSKPTTRHLPIAKRVLTSADWVLEGDSALAKELFALTGNRSASYCIALAAAEKTLLAFEPTSLIVPTIKYEDHSQHDRNLCDVLALIVCPKSCEER